MAVFEGITRVFVNDKLCYIDKTGKFVWRPGESASTTEPVKRSPDKIEVMTFAQMLVEKHLKAPSTAKHPWGTSNYQITDLGDYRYRVSSYVDAQNSFGAMIRTNYTVVIRQSGDSWKLESINTNP